MKKNTKILLAIALIALPAVTGIAYYMLRPKWITDSQKRAQILKLYMGYKNDYIKIGYCTISYRSGVLARGLNQKGIPIYNLRGGLLAWVHDGGKVYNGSKETHRIHVYGQEWNLGPEGYEAVW